MSTTRDQEINMYLFSLAMKGKWGEVVDEYKKNPAIHAAKITKAGDTTLHVAVSDRKTDVVAKMVEIVIRSSRADPKVALGVQNERENTALHFAASMGNVAMCQVIASADPSLVGIRNLDGETPLFLAALHGRTKAFLCLHYISTPNLDTTPNYANCRRDNGDTILHCAIAEDYFDLAFQIIHLYGDLVDCVNRKGYTPLHMLATKPSAFRSGCHLGPVEKILYHCLYVEELKVASYSPNAFSTVPKDKYEFQAVPPHCQTWMDLFGIFRIIVVGVKLACRQVKRAEEDPEIRENDLDQLPVVKRRIQLQSPSPLQLDPQFVPANYNTCFEFVKALYFTMLVTVGQGARGLKTLLRKKEKHVWSVQVMNNLLERASLYGYADMNDGGRPQLNELNFDIENETLPYSFDERGCVSISNLREEQGPPNIEKGQRKSGSDEKDKSLEEEKETLILIAARHGVIEMVEKILESFPVSIHDTNAENKNVVLLAVENRQFHIYDMLLTTYMFLKESLFRNVDVEGNSALHLAARLPDSKPWLYHDTAALLMQREIKWYELVKNSEPSQYFVRYNAENKTADEIFSETHKDLVESGGGWLKKTSESCSVVATLIATVAFATSTAVPGGVQEKTGRPNLEDHPAFMISAMSSLVALYGSVTSMVMFLSILSSRHREYDFATALPRKLMIGLTTLFVSTIAMLVSFSAGHYLSVVNKLQNAAFPIYVVASLPLVIFALSQFPLYLDTFRAMFNKLP